MGRRLNGGGGRRRRRPGHPRGVDASHASRGCRWHDEHEKRTTRDNMETVECPVCMDPIGSDNSCRTECGHVFHSSCAFRAIRTDRRCSICRRELVKEEETQPPSIIREIRVEVAGVDFQEFAEQNSRLRKNYNARRRRVERRNPQLAIAKERWRLAERETTALTDAYNRQYNSEVKKVEDCLLVRNKRRERERHAHRERALKRTYDRMLEQAMGEKPPSSLDQMLVEQLGGHLE